MGDGAYSLALLCCRGIGTGIGTGISRFSHDWSWECLELGLDRCIFHPPLVVSPSWMVHLLYF